MPGLPKSFAPQDGRQSGTALFVARGDYRAHCDRLFFAIPETVPIEIMPEDAGLILADAFGAEILRQAPEHRMAAATRRAVLMRFAHAAAHRLHRLSDPEVTARSD
jgi:hypothetical protein